ncbi:MULTISPECIES: DUF167 domain-containing protein [Agromyces]|uniref:UPF0235 protein GCM10010196_34300 n=1 Tax=Agromyces mediolanus TaxID=41986 RepID=A0A918FH92_AGRME|nr:MULTISPECIES: DUF167 domain-containing protein [Agromyces]MCD1572395.1 DUF167 domain-containing protein [Agromyces mediolanus]GGR37505.1 UPF0235 protein [Agromyces mediolanus]GLJ72972.1 UPF0235 protein [Agromyces mediolanus]GLU90313.1 UPF0235 protein [Agromyces sp. NBRC 114283]
MELTVRVKPGSRKGPLVEPSPDDPAAALTVFVRERAVDGAANAGVIQALAAHFEVPRRDVVIVRGETSRIKRVRIEGR